MATGVLREVLDSDDDREQDDLSSDDSFDNTQSISDESCKEVEDLEHRSVRRITQHVDSESSSVASSSVTESTERSSSSSLLSILKAPKASDLARKRSVLRNLPRGKKKSRGNSTNDPTNIKPTQRIKEYPNEPFVVSNSKLFCNGCREELCIKKSSVKNHIASAKHKKGIERLKKKTAKEKDIAKSLKLYNSVEHLRGETLPEAQQVYRVKVMKAFLQAGVPLAKLDVFKEILEENGYRLCTQRYMFDLIPYILNEEVAHIKSEINGKFVGVVFDGTTHICEALAVVIRFISDSWVIEQRLIGIQLLAKSLSGEEIAREVISLLSTKFGIGPKYLISAMRDRASANNVAMRTIKVVYSNVLDVGCFSHTLDLVGNYFKLPNLTEFLNNWLLLFSHSVKCKFLWQEQTGKTMATYSHTRWWSKWEIMSQILVQFGDVKPFLEKNTDIGSSTRPKLLAFFEDSQKLNHLKIELAAVVDWGEVFVKATYNLEGDGPLALTCYETIQEVKSAIQVGNIPNVQAIAKSISPSSAVQQQLIAHAKNCVEPALNYFRQQLTSSLKVPLAAFKASRLFNPNIIKLLNPDTSSVDALSVIPFFNQEEITALKRELPSYLGKIAAIDNDDSSDVDCLKFWKNSESTLPQWAAAAKKILVVQPSSAAVERVFSMLNNAFKDQQHNSLQDYIEVSTMLRYNNHKNQ